MLKFATAQIIAASLGDQQRVNKAAHRAVFQYEARPGYLYVRSRAISSRCNDNWDEFPAEEIEKAYESFVGKPVFVNHVNDNHRRARGVIISAALHRDRNADGSPDTWVEVLMEVDAIRFPKLAKAILDGHVDRTSMGCDVEKSVCSACGNEATTPAEYCRHIPGMKGRRVYRRTASGAHVSDLIRETCYGLGFFENSLLVEPPADPTAHFLGVDASGLGKAASKKTANSTGPFSWDDIGERHPHVYGDPEIHGEAAEGSDGEGIGDAASHLAHSRPEDPEAEGHSVHDLTFRLQHIAPDTIDHARHEGGDGRVARAAEGYRTGPDQVPPLVVVHRHGVYQVADGHHRAAGAKLAGQKTVSAYVAHSPFPKTPSGDGTKAPYHGAETTQKQKPPRQRSQPPTSGPGWEQRKLFGNSRQATASLPVGSPYCRTCNQDLELQRSPRGTSWAHAGGTVTGHAAVPHDGRDFNQEAHRLDEAAMWTPEHREPSLQEPAVWTRDEHGNLQQAKGSFKEASRLVDASAVLDDGTLRATAYGETRAPADVDTLREECCPVCGDRETYEGETCQVCGFISPPAQFRDPDLDMAKNLDLRKQVVDPSLIDNNGELQSADGQDGMPGQPGDDEVQDPGMVDPDQLDENGLPASPYGDQALDGTQQGPAVSDRNGDGLIQPDEIDPDGNANVQQDGIDPELGGQAGPRELPYGAQDRTGQPFTEGPNMPQRPGEPDGPDEELDGMQAEAPEMGQPGDGVADLLCPSCGFSADATPPQTENMADPAEADDGVVAGDVCPNCQKAQLLTPAELQGGASVPPPVAPRM